MLELREIVLVSPKSPSEWRGLDSHGTRVDIRYRDGALSITHGNDPANARVVCFRMLGPSNDSFMTYAQLRLEVDGILDLP
jgi:hypothetical protein